MPRWIFKSNSVLADDEAQKLWEWWVGSRLTSMLYHFVEIQVVDKILDGTAAHAWNVKEGQIVVMVHTGSVMIGHLCGQYYREVVKKLFPTGVARPDNGVYLLPTEGRFEQETSIFRDALHNAANFAFANRMFLKGGSLRL